MNRLIHQIKILFLFLLGVPCFLGAQISEGGIPLSSQPTFSKSFTKKLKPTTVSKLDMEKVLKEDKASPWASRFAAPTKVNFDLNNSGEWTAVNNGDRIWQLDLKAEGALALSILYDDFYIPPGAKFFVYSPDKSQVLGAYTSKNNRDSRKFMTGLIRGEEAVLEYYEPKRVRGLGKIHIFRIDQAYKKEAIEPSDYEFQVHAGASVESGFGSSFDCHENADCETDSELQLLRDGYCRITVVVEEGTGYCTGNVMNNTSVDGKPYILSAFHCQDGFTPVYDYWKFDFNYEGSNCSIIDSEPVPKSMLGAKFLSGRQESDFILLELHTRIPDDFNVYYLGWDRSGGTPDKMTYFHHPLGDVKKIGKINRKSEVFSFPIDWDNGVSTPPDHHLRIVYNTGFFQPGSSGAGLLDNNLRVVGQLHGGNSDCDGSTAYFGRMSQSWEGGGTPETRLRDWLDPLNSGAPSLDGTRNTGEGTASLAGTVLTQEGDPIIGVTITLTGPRVDMTTTNASGEYVFEGLKTGEQYGLMLSKDGNDINGVTVNDVIVIQKHILATDFIEDPYKLLAADVDQSGSVSTIDRIKIQKLIIGLEAEFEDAPSWQFLPEGYTFTDPTNPLREERSDTFYVKEFNESVSDFNFIGLKTGDVNCTADPTK